MAVVPMPQAERDEWIAHVEPPVAWEKREVDPRPAESTCRHHHE